MILTMVFASFALGFATLAWRTNSTSAEEKAKVKFVRGKEWIQKTFAEPLWAFEQEKIIELADTLIHSPEPFLFAIKVYDRDGEVLGSVSHEGDLGDSFIQEQFPVYFGDQKVGEVLLTAKPQNLWDYLKNISILIWSATLIMIVMIAVFSFLILEHFLTGPFMELIHHMRQAEKADYKVSFTQTYSSELGILARSFQRAIVGIEHRDQELSNYASNLEALVDARTTERDLERMKAINSAKLASLGEISAGIAHEVNNPLTIIQGKVDSMLSMLTRGHTQPEQLQPHLDKITSMVQRITRIIRGLKYFARDPSSDPRLEFSVQSMIEEVQSLCMSKIKEHGISFQLVIPPEEIFAMGREVQLSQVIVNLLQNSIDAVKDQKGALIGLHVTVSEGRCHFAVIDNGPGVPEDLKEKIFQPFFTTKPIGKGTGLGLSIAHGIIQQHQSELSLEREDSLTVFRFSIAKAEDQISSQAA